VKLGLLTQLLAVLGLMAAGGLAIKRACQPRSTQRVVFHQVKPKTTVRPKPKAKRKPRFPITRWKDGTRDVVSMQLDAISAKLAHTSHLEKCEATFRRYGAMFGTEKVIAAPTGLFYDPGSADHHPVGANILPDGITPKLHKKDRMWLVIPHDPRGGDIRFVDKWEEVYVLRRFVYAIEMGPTVYPFIRGACDEASTLTRQTARYMVAIRKPNELLLVFDSNGSLESLHEYCARLHVKKAALLDGGSSIKQGTYYHVVILASVRPA
jgi:hypothetical protein